MQDKKVKRGKLTFILLEAVGPRRHREGRRAGSGARFPQSSRTRRDARLNGAKAFSSEVGTGSRKENGVKTKKLEWCMDWLGFSIVILRLLVSGFSPRVRPR